MSKLVLHSTMKMCSTNNKIKIATLNLCLGLKNKKLEIENLLAHNHIDLLCLQEVEFESRLDPSPLKIKNYNFELEVNSLKSRVGIYINENLEYNQMKHLEGNDSHIVIIDLVKSSSIKRIVNVYRSFNPQNNVQERTKFKYQLNIIRAAMWEGCLLLGDFNLDYLKVNDVTYGHKNFFMDFNEVLAEYNLIQLVNFVTWSRMNGNNVRTSILDHIYVKNPLNITDLGFINPFFGG